MHRHAAVLVVAIALTGCAVQGLGESTTWERLNVEGLQLELVDEEKFELLKFGPQGMVAATVGTKRGALIGPLWYWRIEGEHLIISERPKDGTYADLHAPKLNGSFLFVRRGLFSNANYAVKHSDA